MMHFPVDHIFDAAPGAAEERILLLMLPGAKNTPRQLVEHGFIRALRERDLPVDVLALHAHADLYLDGEVDALLREAFRQIAVQGYKRIWLLGISLGGSGAMMGVVKGMAPIEGVFLIAPFLGTRGIIAEVRKAGGLPHWDAGEIAPRDHERRLLHHLRHAVQARALPQIHLGFGSEDHYRGASDLLAAHLPPQRVTVLPGGHDWETWGGLWRLQLAGAPFVHRDE